MYYYIYDSFLNEKTYQTTLAKIETRLTDLGINGKINRLSFLKNIQQIIFEEAKRGVKTLVVVGNDKTLGQILNIVVDLDITIALIPIGKNNHIAQLLGIPEGEPACDILSSRIINHLDLGQINNYYFLSSLVIGSKQISLECDNGFWINLEGKNNLITIANLEKQEGISIDPTDGKLNIIVANQQKKWFKTRTIYSYFAAKKIWLDRRKPVSIFLSDEKKIVKSPASINILPKKIKMIVGKNRAF
ncbi:MAG: diacylglycerol kinase family protein [bacterium]